MADEEGERRPLLQNAATALPPPDYTPYASSSSVAGIHRFVILLIFRLKIKQNYQ